MAIFTIHKVSIELLLAYRNVPSRCALDFLCNSNFYQFICLFEAVLPLKGENNWCFDCQYNCDELNNNSNNGEFSKNSENCFRQICE